MTTKSTGYGLDFLLVYSWDWWKDPVNTGRAKLEEDYKDDERNKASQTPLTINDSGPSERKQTYTAGPHPPESVAGSIELAMMEICPVCEETLHLYKTKDVQGRLTFRCKNCFVKLKKSPNGWIEDKD